MLPTSNWGVCATAEVASSTANRGRTSHARAGARRDERWREVESSGGRRWHAVDALTTGPGLRSAVCGLRSAVCGLRSAVCGLRSAVCGLRSAVCGQNCGGHSSACQAICCNFFIFFSNLRRCPAYSPQPVHGGIPSKTAPTASTGWMRCFDYPFCYFFGDHMHQLTMDYA